MNNIQSDATGLFDHIKELINVKVESIKLNTAARSAEVLANLLGKIILFISLLFVLLFISIGLAWVLSDWIGKPYYGFFIIGAIYLVAGALLWRYRQRLIGIPILNNMLGVMNSSNDSNEKV